MARKKKAEMTPVELIDQALKGRTWEEAEVAGIEVLARCMALHLYARKEGDEYFSNLMESICKRADEWAHNEGLYVLAFASAGYKRQQEEERKQL